MLLSNGGVSALEQRYDVYNLRMGLNGLDIGLGFSVYTFDIHRTKACNIPLHEDSSKRG